MTTKEKVIAKCKDCGKEFKVSEYENCKCFKKLQKENDKLRHEIDRLLETPEEEYKEKVWKQINLLIENEIEQESYCNQ